MSRTMTVGCDRCTLVEEIPQGVKATTAFEETYFEHRVALLCPPCSKEYASWHAEADRIRANAFDEFLASWVEPVR